jgi:hypothetical protein
MYRAGATLTEAAAEAWAMQTEFVAQHIEQRHLRVVVGNGHAFAVYSE